MKQFTTSNRQRMKPKTPFQLPFSPERATLPAMIRRVMMSWLGAVSILSVCAGQTEYLFLVTGDGIRHQELFGGVDPQLMTEGAKKWSGIQNLATMRERFWAESAAERREKL